jgi:hypothetical protein
MISLEVSEDGTSITALTFTFDETSKCPGITISGGEVSMSEAGPFPITEGNIDASLANGGELKGRFTSPTEASGTITVKGLPYSDACQFGPLNWSAMASASASEQASSDATTEAAPTTEAPTQGASQPQPGVTLSGEIEASDIADSATINLKVSEDGTSITQVDVAITNVSVECSSDAASGSIESDSSEMSFMGPYPITEGAVDASLSNDGKLQGMFTSPTEANGTINIISKQPDGAGGSMLCNFGTWEWSATAK